VELAFLVGAELELQGHVAGFRAISATNYTNLMKTAVG
jgi:hypothetical protein